MENSKYKILIVDENQEQIDDFATFFETAGVNDFEIVSLNALENDDELIDFVIDEEVNAVAFDYKLKENNSTFEKNGDAYQNVLLSTFENFPTFIITNNSADSKSMNTDPFKVIDKRIIYFNSEDEEQTLEAKELINKIRLSIDKYQENLQSFEEEMYSLIEKQNKGEELDDTEIARMIDLDSKLENSISKRSGIPKDWKSPAGIDAINNLVNASQEILAELKKLNEHE